MLRIITCFLLLIISQISSASVSTSNSIVPATAVTQTSAEACKAVFQAKPANIQYNRRFVSINWDSGNGACNVAYSYGGAETYPQDVLYSISTTYSCSSGTLSDASGNPSSSGHYCNTTVTTDSCAAYKDQTGYFWVSYKSHPAVVCSGTCLATPSSSYGDVPDYPYDRYVSLKYTYTGQTGSCTTDSGFVDSSAAATANTAADAKDLADKIQKAIDDAITACGGTGHYTRGTFNGDTVIVCTNQDNVTKTTQTTNTASGSISTDTTTTTTNNNGKTTTIGSDGSSKSTGGTSSTSTTTNHTSPVTNPDGSTTTTSEASGASSTLSFTSPDAGKDYLSDLFGSADLQALASKKTEIENSISAKKSQIKGLFHFNGISISGSLSENVQEIKGGSIDLSGRSTFDRFSYIASILFFTAVVIAIWIVLGGKK